MPSVLTALVPGLAEAALGEGTGVKLHKLSVKELKDVRSDHYLFLPRGLLLSSFLAWTRSQRVARVRSRKLSMIRSGCELMMNELLVVRIWYGIS